MTFRELQDAVLGKMGELTGSQVFHLRSDVMTALNEGYETISEATEWYEKNITLSYTNTLYYNLLSASVYPLADTVPVLTPTALFSNQNNRWMRQTTYRELDEEVYAPWELAIGEPDYWLMRGGWWLGTYPKKTVTSGTAIVHTTAMPVLLSADGDIPGFPAQFHKGLQYYAIYDLYCQEREWKKAERYWLLYLTEQGNLQDWVDHHSMTARMTQFGGFLG